MTAREAMGFWDFTQKIIYDESLIECPECEWVSPLFEWREGEVYCEVCGDHAAMVCPHCDERFDHVRGPTFVVH